MKLVLMTYYVGIHREVMEVLGELGICTYVRWREVEGRISCRAAFGLAERRHISVAEIGRVLDEMGFGPGRFGMRGRRDKEIIR